MELNGKGMKVEMMDSGLAVARLNVGIGKVGEHTMLRPEEEGQFTGVLLGYTGEPNYVGDVPSSLSSETESVVTAMCIDDRTFLAFANGQSDPEFFRGLITYGAPGGAVLAVTKAFVAARPKVIEGIYDFTDMYVFSGKLLQSLGILDAGHMGCAAEELVKESVEKALSPEQVAQNMGGFILLGEHDIAGLEIIRRNKLEAADGRRFDSWTPRFHQDHLRGDHPSRYATLDTTPEDPVLKGHTAAGLLIPEHGGFNKNLATEETGKKFFNLSNEFIHTVADRVGVTREESRLIYLALYDDAINVGNQIFYPGMPALTDMDPSAQQTA